MNYVKFIFPVFLILAFYFQPMTATADIAEPDSEVVTDSETGDENDTDSTEAVDDGDDSNCSFTAIHSKFAIPYLAVAAMVVLGLWLGRRAK